MKATRRITATALVTLLGVGTAATPALAASGSHWSKSQCSAYAKRFKSASKGSKATANKALKAHGCTVRVK